jgi:TolA-binding protein
MKVLSRFLFVFAMLPAASLLGQQPDIVDPTSVSPEIQTQLDAIRGVEEMQALKKQLQEVTSQNKQLMERLLQATEQLEAMQGQIDTLRQGKEDAARRRSALPELRLVSQVRTLSMKRADISAGERTYRVTDGRPFRMALSNDEIVTATPTFLQDGTVEVSIKDLDATQMLSFRPSPPDPSRARARSSRASDG